MLEHWIVTLRAHGDNQKHAAMAGRLVTHLATLRNRSITVTARLAAESTLSKARRLIGGSGIKMAAGAVAMVSPAKPELRSAIPTVTNRPERHRCHMQPTRRTRMPANWS